MAGWRDSMEAEQVLVEIFELTLPVFCLFVSFITFIEI